MIFPIGFAIYALAISTQTLDILFFWPIPHIISLAMGIKALRENRQTDQGQVSRNLAHCAIGLNIAAICFIMLVVVGIQALVWYEEITKWRYYIGGAI